MIQRTFWEGMPLSSAIVRSHQLLDYAQHRHNPVAVVGLFSGGNDSTTLMHMLRDRVDLIAHINTGIGVEDTREFVRRTVREWEIPYLEVSPPPGCDYETLVLAHGFPGPAGHGMMYRRLKERALRKVRRRLVKNGRKERVIFLAGIRRSESQRRADRTEIDRDGSVVWVSPMIHWSEQHLKEYRRVNDVPVNEVAANLHMSGECLCGAFAKPGEREMIKFFYPDTDAYLAELEARVAAAGQPGCVWGQRPPKRGAAPAGRLCSSCTMAEPGISYRRIRSR